MIKEIISVGGIETAHHTFSFSQVGMTLKISAGSFFIKGNPVVTSQEETNITFPTPNVDTYYTVYLTKDNGIYVRSIPVGGSPNSVANFDTIDTLAWLTIPAGTSSLDNVEINVIKVVTG